jgi:hypothetical protein
LRTVRQAGLTIILATYEIDRIPKRSSGCLIIKQQYVFEQAVDTEVEPAFSCEGSFAPLRRQKPFCARFRPIVSYDYSSLSDGPFLRTVNTVQRLDFLVDGRPTVAALIRDLDSPLPFQEWAQRHLVLPFVLGENPLSREQYFHAIVDGRAGQWDNVHLTDGAKIGEPVPPPGCPECVHIHWRWGGFLDFPNGRPLIGAGSDQSVDIALTSEDHQLTPTDFDQFPAPQPLARGGVALWYSATSRDDNDVFFSHGGFFDVPAEDVTKLVKLRMVRQEDRPSNHEIYQEWEITNTSSKPIEGQISLVCDNLTGALPTRSWRLNRTTVVGKLGSPYTTAYDPRPGQFLAPGQTISVELLFERPAVLHPPVISFTPRVLATDGLR